MIVVSGAFAATLSGVVTEADGGPSVGATVTVHDARAVPTVTLTDSSGAWSIGGLPSSWYRLQVTPDNQGGGHDSWGDNAQRYCDSPFVRLQDEEQAQLDLTLREAGRVQGRVIDVDGEPVAGVVVLARNEVDPVSGAEIAPGRALTAADGTFDVGGIGLPPAYTGRLSLEFRPPDGPPQFNGPSYSPVDVTTFDVRAVEAPIDFELIPSASALGEVLGAAGRGGDAFLYDGHRTHTAPLDGDGRFRFDGLKAEGTWLAWADVPGFARSYLADSPVPDETVEAPEPGGTAAGLVIRLQPGGSLRGRFLDAPEGLIIGAENAEGSVFRANYVGDDGRFVIEDLSAGPWSLSLFGEATDTVSGPLPLAPEVVAGGETDLGDLPVPWAGIIEGRVVEPGSGRPVVGAQVFALDTQLGWTASAAQTDRDGVYRLRVAPGVYQLQAHHDRLCDRDVDFVSIFWPSSLSSLVVGSVEVGAQATFRWDVQMPIDTDADEMGDAWEVEHGLDPAVRDALEDRDGDGFTNLQEYRLGTDPNDLYEAEPCGCRAGGGPTLLALLALLPWVRRRACYDYQTWFSSSQR